MTTPDLADTMYAPPTSGGLVTVRRWFVGPDDLTSVERELAEAKARIARLRRQVEAVEAKCNTEIASYKGASGNYDSYHEGRSDAGAAILDALEGGA